MPPFLDFHKMYAIILEIKLKKRFKYSLYAQTIYGRLKYHMKVNVLNCITQTPLSICIKCNLTYSSNLSSYLTKCFDSHAMNKNQPSSLLSPHNLLIKKRFYCSPTMTQVQSFLNNSVCCLYCRHTLASSVWSSTPTRTCPSTLKRS